MRSAAPGTYGVHEGCDMVFETKTQNRMEADMNFARRIGCRVVGVTFPGVRSHLSGGTVSWCRLALALVLGTGLATAVPAIARGQSSGDNGSSGTTAEHYAQIMRAQAVLIELPQMFQRDAELEALRQAFEEALVDAMADLDPQTAQRLARLLELEAQASTEGVDQGALLEEGRELRDELLATAAQARRRPAVAAAAEPFNDALKVSVENLDGIDADTLSIVTEGNLLIEAVTVMTVLSQ